MKNSDLLRFVPATPVLAGGSEARTASTPTKRTRGATGCLRERGFTIVELIVVVTIISMLTSLAVIAYNKVLNGTRLVKANALVSTLATAKTAFVADPSTSRAAIQKFNSAPDANFASIAPYIRVNGVQPVSEDDLRKLAGFPSSMSIALGRVDDSGLGGSNADQAPAVAFSGKRQNGDFEN
jgi:prepilin-type N-terminal cleavage/methylation domain-containing protein